LQATGKVWTKKQLQEKWKKMIAGEKKVGDANRLRQFTKYVMKTGNLPAPLPFVPTPADDIEPGRVDPRILTGKDPVFDKHSLVTVEAGSCFSSGQELSGVGVSRVAPKPPRLAPVATVTSGAYETEIEIESTQSTSASQHENTEDEYEAEHILLDVSNEPWSYAVLDNSEVSEHNTMRTVVLAAATSTPTKSHDNTFSTVNLTPIRASSTIVPTATNSIRQR
jgi:hypothetical protein